MTSLDSKIEWDKRAFVLAVAGQVGVLVAAVMVLLGSRAGVISGRLTFLLLLILVALNWWHSRWQWNRIGRFKRDVEAAAPGVLASHGVSASGTVMYSDRLQALQSVASDPRVVGDSSLRPEAEVVSALLLAQRVGLVVSGVAGVTGLVLLVTVFAR